MGEASLADREVVYVWAGIYVKAGLERDKAALLVVMGAMRDGREVLTVHQATGINGWAEVFRVSRLDSAEVTDGRR